MTFNDLRAFLKYLEANRELHRIPVEVDPDQEITIIQHRVLEQQGPALLFERVKGSPYRVVTNLFGTPKRVQLAFGGPPAALGQAFATLGEQLLPPSPSALWTARRDLWRLGKAGLSLVRKGPILESCFEPPRLNQLPCLKCWPLDGGNFFTLPLVHTVDPVTGRGNLGVYRLQRFDDDSTGMHWQIEKGGGFHFHRASELGRPLDVSVFLGGPPALTLAAIAPLPEGVDERILASIIMGQRLKSIRRSTTGHKIPASAEFILEGSVTAGDLSQEGPFGDHLGHYSHSAQFPVYRVKRLLARQDAIYPATVVGKPPQEDYFIGEALQDLSIPILKIIKPGISDLWAYPETGFHPLAVLAVRERYHREALKHALSMLGEGQVSLTKVLMVVDASVNVRDFKQVSRALWQHLDADGVHLLVPTAQDTLDFTGPAMNSGSRLILLATGESDRPLRRSKPPSEEMPSPTAIHDQILGLKPLGEAILVVQTAMRDAITDVTNDMAQALAVHPATRDYLFQVLVSPDVPLDDPRLILWGWFTRFDPATDLHPARRELQGNRLILHFPILIDARWKTGYRQPVAFDPDKKRYVDQRWKEYGFPF